MKFSRNQSYKYVLEDLEDLENYYPKLVKDGILCGYDFFMRLNNHDLDFYKQLSNIPA